MEDCSFVLLKALGEEVLYHIVIIARCGFVDCTLAIATVGGATSGVDEFRFQQGSEPAAGFQERVYVRGRLKFGYLENDLVRERKERHCIFRFVVSW